MPHQLLQQLSWNYINALATKPSHVFLFLVLGASEEERKHKLEGEKRKKTEDSGDSEEGTVVVCLLDSNIILAKSQSADM